MAQRLLSVGKTYSNVAENGENGSILVLNSESVFTMCKSAANGFNFVHKLTSDCLH